MRLARTLSEQLQIYMILGDDRAVAGTYILGRAVPRRAGRP
jgi:hypothetical protein